MAHALDRDDVALEQLADELSTAAGFPVTLSVRLPGQTDNEGNTLDGMLVLRDPDSGEEAEVDDGVVADVIADHIPPPVVDANVELAKAIEAATTLDELKAALLGSVEPAAAAGRPA